MESITSIITAICGILFGAGSGILYFRPKLKEAKVNADRVQTGFLEERIESLGKLYTTQGQVLDELRSKILEMGKEIAEKDERIQLLERTNEEMSEKIDSLTKEVDAYRTINSQISERRSTLDSHIK